MNVAPTATVVGATYVSVTTDVGKLLTNGNIELIGGTPLMGIMVGITTGLCVAVAVGKGEGECVAVVVGEGVRVGVGEGEGEVVGVGLDVGLIVGLTVGPNSFLMC